MRDFDEFNITQAVLDRFGDTPDPRLKQVVTSLVTHLHNFVRDVGLTFEEWQAGIEFLTRTGQTCDEHRQEFILLSDTLGVSMLVDAINHRQPQGATETTVLGPFYVEDAAECPNGADIAGHLEGVPLLVTGTVLSAGGETLGGARVDVWHCDNDGFYDVQQLGKHGQYAGRATFRTGPEGRFHFWSIMPRWYPIPDNGPVGAMLKATSRHPNRPAHVHFMISAEGHETLTTHVFADDSPWLDSDAVFGVKNALIAPFVEKAAGLASDGRTVDRPYRQLDYGFGLVSTRKRLATQ